MKFNYQARNKTGQVQVGVVEASSKEAALQILSRNELYVTILEQEATERPIYAKRLAFFDRIPPKEIMLFSRQLSIMFQSQVPLVEALRTISLQTKNPNFKEKILKISESVEGGTSLSGALSQFSKVFSPYYVSIIKSGEASGSLSQMLDSLADHLDREYALSSKIKGALTYPAFVIFIGVAVLFLMMFFVVPNLVKVLGTSAKQLPLATRIVIFLADALRKWWWALFLGIAVACVSFVKYIRTKGGKKAFDVFMLKVPVIGSFLGMMYLSRFAENLSTLVTGGIPIVEALGITQDIISNEVYKNIIGQAKEAVRNGSSINEVLSQYPGAFPPIFTQMVAVGEKSGTLDTSLLNMVKFYQKEVENMVDSLLSILEPLLIVVLGVVIGGLMASILLPLYQSISF